MADKRPRPDFLADPALDSTSYLPMPRPSYVQQVMNEAQYSDQLLDQMRQAQSTDRDNSQ